MIVKYQKNLPGVETWEDVKSLDEINFEFLPYVFALEDTQTYESPTGMRFRAFWVADDGSSESHSPMIAKLCQRLRHAEIDKEHWEKQAGQSTDRDSRFKELAVKHKWDIQIALSQLATDLARAFEGSHNERHQKLAAAMTQIPNISALCEKIPDLLLDAATDIPF